MKTMTATKQAAASRARRARLHHPCVCCRVARVHDRRERCESCAVAWLITTVDARLALTDPARLARIREYARRASGNRPLFS